jgi:opacity protein-like surface antigen
MKRFLIALSLTCVLSGSVLAEDVDTAGAPAPAPVPNGMTAEAPGDMPTAGSTSPADIPTCGMSVLLTILDLAL